MFHRGGWAVRALLLLVLAVPVVACGAKDNGTVRLAQLGSTFCIDAWDEDGERGDEALVERKVGEDIITDAFVIPADAPIRYTCGGEFDTKIELSEDGTYTVLDMGNAKLGEDHDLCLAKTELYAKLGPNVDVSDSGFEQRVDDPDNSGDDCVRGPNSEG